MSAEIRQRERLCIGGRHGHGNCDEIEVEDPSVVALLLLFYQNQSPSSISLSPPVYIP